MSPLTVTFPLRSGPDTASATGSAHCRASSAPAKSVTVTGGS
ncbi:hypothetical protein [Paractinoplanes lichenicola]|nr:hypothetical protein [Actinoplanes lichenicola]